MRYLANFLAALVVLNLVVMIAETIGNLNNLTTRTGSWQTGLLMVSLRVPSWYFRITFPMAAFLAALMAFGTAARTNEIIAMKACGISPLRLLAPVLLAAILLSCVTAVTYEWASVRASRTLVRHKHGGDQDLTFENGAFWLKKGTTIYRVRDGNLSKSVLRGIKVYERDEKGRLLRSTTARKARIKDDEIWVLLSPTIHSFDPTDPSKAPTIERPETREIAGIDRRTLTYFDPGEMTFSLRQLREVIEARLDDGAQPTVLQSHLHLRYTDPLIVLLFTCFAAPLGLRVERTKTIALPAMQGVALIALFWGIRSFTGNLATKGVVPPYLPYWAVLLLFLGYSGWLILGTRKQMR